MKSNATFLNRTIQTFLFVLVIAPDLIRSQLSTSLYVPGFDPQPLSADVIGIGSDGRTTWALHKGQPDATDTSSYADFIGTATLIQGPNDVYLTYANSRAQLTLGEECTFSGSPATLAICTVVAQGSTATQTEAVSYLPIQGGGVGPPSSGSPISSPSAPGFTTGSSTMVKGTDGASSGTDMVSDSSGAVTPAQSGALPSTSSSSLPSSSNYKPAQFHWLVLVVLPVSLFYLIPL